MEEYDMPEEEILAEDPTFENQHVVEQEGLYEYATSIITSYGWFIIIGCFCIYILWVKVLQSKFQAWQSRRRADDESARYHKDPDLARDRLLAMEAARARMQAEHDAASLAYAEKLKEKEETKRAQKIDEWEKHKNGLGYRNRTRVEEAESGTSNTVKKTKPRLRNNDFNPLAGSGGSCYRPSRSGGASGGG